MNFGSSWVLKRQRKQRSNCQEWINNAASKGTPEKHLLLEGLMLKLKLQSFGHLMGRTNSLEKTLMLGKIEGRRRREQQRMESPTRRTRVWPSSGSWCWTGRIGVLQSVGLPSRTWLGDWTELSFASLTMQKPLTVWITINCGKFLQEMGVPDHLLVSWETCRQVKKQQLESDMEEVTGSNLGREYSKAVCCHLAYLTSTQCTSCKMSGWMEQKLEARLLGEISTTS